MKEMEEKNNKKYFDKMQMNSELQIINDKVNLMSNMDAQMKNEELNQKN
jgi:hypothetical protein